MHGQVAHECDTNYIDVFFFPQEAQTLLASRKKREALFVIKMLPTIHSII